eukprot:Skav234024  [mRNA]  locus=scaffold1243:131037:132346:- [translate_table: standard]
MIDPLRQPVGLVGSSLNPSLRGAGAVVDLRQALDTDGNTMDPAFLYEVKPHPVALALDDGDKEDGDKEGLWPEHEAANASEDAAQQWAGALVGYPL